MPPNFKVLRHKVYCSGDEQAIRYFFLSFGVATPGEQFIFWCTIYTAIRSLYHRFPDVEPKVITEADQLILLKSLDITQLYTWWMINERATIFFECNVKATCEPVLNRFHFGGHVYPLQKDFYS